MNDALLNAALAYEARGWSIIPIGRNKKPALKAWKQFQSDRPTATQLGEWFEKPGRTGVAVILGEVSGGLACRDFDTEDAYQAWAKRYPKWARTLPTSRTARGFHVYFTCAGCRSHVCLDGELRSDGLYVVLPPSRHPSGAMYAWLVPLPSGPVPRCDPTKVGLVGTPASKRVPRADTEQGHQGRPSNDPAVPIVPARRETDSVPEWKLERKLLQHAIEKCAIRGPKQHDAMNTAIAREAKFTLRCTDLRAARQVFDPWWDDSGPFASETCRDSAWAKFQRGFETARFPPGARGFVAQARKSAASAPPPSAAAMYTNPKLRLLVAICFHMDRLIQGRFKLSSHQAAAAIGVAPTQAWTWLGMLTKDKVVCCHDRGRAGRPGHNAAVYSWTGGKE